MLNEASCRSLEGSVDRSVVCREGKSSHRVRVYSSENQCPSFMIEPVQCHQCAPRESLLMTTRDDGASGTQCISAAGGLGPQQCLWPARPWRVEVYVAELVGTLHPCHDHHFYEPVDGNGLPRRHSGKESVCGFGPWGQEDLLEEEMATHSSILGLENSTDRGVGWAIVHVVAVRHD